MQKWEEQPPIKDQQTRLTHQGLSLWVMGRREITSSLKRVLRKTEALKQILTEIETNLPVYSLEQRGVLTQAFLIASAETGYDGKINRIKAKKPIYHNITTLLRGGKGQVARDLYFGLRSNPLPHLFSPHSASSDQPYLFLVNSYPTYFLTLLPVIKRIACSHPVIIINTKGIIRSNQLQHLHYISQFVPLKAWRRISKRGQKLRQAWQRLEAETPMDSFQYQGHSLWPAFRIPLKKHFLEHMPRTAVWIEGLANLYTSIQPSAVIAVPDLHFPARTAFTLARRHDIPSLTVQPALISDHPQYGEACADRVAAIDEYSRQIYIRRGSLRPDQVIKTGLPRWDTIETADRKETEAMNELRAQVGLAPTDRIILFATQPLPISYTERVLKAIVRGLKPYDQDNLRLVIKLHPRESLDVYNNLHFAQGAAISPIVVKNVDLRTLLVTSELLITGFSNVALEAALLDKPVLIINLTGTPDPLPFVENGLALKASSEQEVEKRIAELLSSSATAKQLRASRHQYIEENPQLLDGCATDRIVDIIQKMAYQ